MSMKEYLQQFLDHVEELAEEHDGIDGFTREFNRLKQISEQYRATKEFPTEHGQFEENRKKNRYKDILPFDHSRVVLDITDENEASQSDYINANFIKGVNDRETYIASQGPLPNTVGDFWRMLWDYNIQVVVMVCNEREGPVAKQKCARYWPDGGIGQDFGAIHVILESNRQISRDFLVKTLRARRGAEERLVYQFHYCAWPDHGVPLTVTPILDMIAMVRDYQPKELPPICVHCSAGCGRTGTVCAIDYAWTILKMGKLTSDFNLFDIIYQMRRQRQSIVQAKDQYILVHQAIAELFERHLELIEQNPYENCNVDGEALVNCEDSSEYADVESLAESSAVAPPTVSDTPDVVPQDEIYAEVGSPTRKTVKETLVNLINMDNKKIGWGDRKTPIKPTNPPPMPPVPKGRGTEVKRRVQVPSNDEDSSSTKAQNLQKPIKPPIPAKRLSKHNKQDSSGSEEEVQNREKDASGAGHVTVIDVFVTRGPQGEKSQDGPPDHGGQSKISRGSSSDSKDSSLTSRRHLGDADYEEIGNIVINTTHRQVHDAEHNVTTISIGKRGGQRLSEVLQNPPQPSELPKSNADAGIQRALSVEEEEDILKKKIATKPPRPSPPSSRPPGPPAPPKGKVNQKQGPPPKPPHLPAPSAGRGGEPRSRPASLTSKPPQPPPQRLNSNKSDSSVESEDDISFTYPELYAMTKRKEKENGGRPDSDASSNAYEEVAIASPSRVKQKAGQPSGYAYADPEALGKWSLQGLARQKPPRPKPPDLDLYTTPGQSVPPFRKKKASETGSEDSIALTEGNRSSGDYEYTYSTCDLANRSPPPPVPLKSADSFHVVAPGKVAPPGGSPRRTSDPDDSGGSSGLNLGNRFKTQFGLGKKSAPMAIKSSHELIHEPFIYKGKDLSYPNRLERPRGPRLNCRSPDVAAVKSAQVTRH